MSERQYGSSDVPRINIDRTLGSLVAATSSSIIKFLSLSIASEAAELRVKDELRPSKVAEVLDKYRVHFVDMLFEIEYLVNENTQISDDFKNRITTFLQAGLEAALKIDEIKFTILDLISKGKKQQALIVLNKCIENINIILYKITADLNSMISKLGNIKSL